MKEEKSHYEVYRERVREEALKLDKAPKEISQTILWLKSIAIERIEEIDELGENEKVFTFIKGEKFGFTEPYVNLLMHYAYEAGRKSLASDYQRASERMDKALEDIAEIIKEAGYSNCSEY
jgi:hypothetical protein